MFLKLFLLWSSKCLVVSAVARFLLMVIPMVGVNARSAILCNRVLVMFQPMACFLMTPRPLPKFRILILIGMIMILMIFVNQLVCSWVVAHGVAGGHHLRTASDTVLLHKFCDIAPKSGPFS